MNDLFWAVCFHYMQDICIHARDTVCVTDKIVIVNSKILTSNIPFSKESCCYELWIVVFLLRIWWLFTTYYLFCYVLYFENIFSLYLLSSYTLRCGDCLTAYFLCFAARFHIDLHVIFLCVTTSLFTGNDVGSGCVSAWYLCCRKNTYRIPANKRGSTYKWKSHV